MRIGLFLSSTICCLFADVQNEGLLKQASFYFFTGFFEKNHSHPILSFQIIPIYITYIKKILMLCREKT